jgi:hypothetical protein
MNLTVILFLIFFAMVALVVWRMKMAGEISGFAPQTHRERVRLYWLIAGVVNFLAFLIHAGFDHGGFAFPAGGRLVGDIYLVTQHGRDFSFTPARYFFSYWHGVVFVVVHLICTVAIWRLRKTGDVTDDLPSA